ncbi:MAG: DUF4847 domain-containing protein [Mediterranea massiliensis]|nr:DUF4847 domain-containing protein [Mediterranea massiliensis]
MKYTHYLYIMFFFVVAGPLLSGCNNEDDVMEIFTGKMWKLSYIAAEGTRIQFNYWPNDNANGEAYQHSMELLRKADNFTITFTGGEINNVISGTFSGKGSNATLNGQWKANGESQSLSMNTNVSGRETDPLARAFVNGLQNVIRYEGDAMNLFIYFKDGETVKYMGLKPQ